MRLRLSPRCTTCVRAERGPYRSMDGSGTGNAAATMAGVGMRIIVPRATTPVFRSAFTFGLYLEAARGHAAVARQRRPRRGLRRLDPAGGRSLVRHAVERGVEPRPRSHRNAYR